MASILVKGFGRGRVFQKDQKGRFVELDFVELAVTSPRGIVFTAKFGLDQLLEALKGPGQSAVDSVHTTEDQKDFVR